MVGRVETSTHNANASAPTPTPHHHNQEKKPTSNPHRQHRHPDDVLRRTSYCHAGLAATVRCKPCSYQGSSTVPPSSSGHTHMVVDLSIHGLASVEVKRGAHCTTSKRPPLCMTQRRSTVAAPYTPNDQNTAPDPGPARQLETRGSLTTSTVAHHSSDTSP
ncbi:hypothetical protein SEVIR_9G258766v4 [Setaria viridis]|uniref:Uncharacterized protein n=1 Tax=Setaria viridis TaxID=4556 RepID=A0A4U6SXR0_SETVI|nr:hypothetical protein SEVIR_9G258766v2 [Setaria viridis]